MIGRFPAIATAPTTPYEREVRAFAQRAAAAAYEEPRTSERAAYIFCAHYGLEPEATSLAAIGRRLGLSRERISQIFDRVRERAVAGSLPKMPGTRRLHQSIVAYLPAPLAMVDREFRDRLGPNASSRDVLRFATDFLGLNSARVKGSRLPLTSATTQIARGDDSPAWFDEAWRLGAEQTRRYGAAQLDLIAGIIAQQMGIAVSRATLSEAVSVHPGFVWLDEPTGWFCFTTGESPSFESRLRKLLAVADGHLPLDDFLSATSTTWRWNDLGRGITPLNLHYHIVVARLRTLDWVTVDRGNHIRSKAALAPAYVLSGAERVIVATIERHGGTATTAQLRGALLGAGFTVAAVGRALSCSPILKSLGRGLYALRGRPESHRVPPQARRSRKLAAAA